MATEHPLVNSQTTPWVIATAPPVYSQTHGKRMLQTAVVHGSRFRLALAEETYWARVLRAAASAVPL
jgi:hypothetical protein